nr:toll/interleukin-1 receptor domain-containing protein [Arthrospiribacter ruber]
MAKAFLSHSSIDKPLVEKISSGLGTLSIIDSKTFEEGMGNLEEIIFSLDKTDLFVLFISDKALKSKWVQEEIVLAKERNDINLIKRFFPIIIDENINHQDARIPQWIKDNYNLKPVLRYGKILRLIKRRLREIVWDRHPILKQRDQLFVGRNEILKKFEERIDDINLEEPFVIVSSGLKRIGRRTFIKKALLKGNVIFKESYDFPVITISSRESIEDFILKIYDLGFSSEREFPDFMEIDLNEKIDLAISLLKDCQKVKELVLVEDTGGIVLPDRTISIWFMKILEHYRKYGLEDKTTICIASDFRVLQQSIVHYDSIVAFDIQELTKKERTGLFKRSTSIFNLDISNDDLNYFIENTSGFPEQIYFCMDFIRKTSVKEAKENIEIIKNYQKELFSSIVKDIELSSEAKFIISTLVEFDFISTEFLCELHPEIELDVIEKQIVDLNGKALVEYIGANKEYIRLNDGIRDFLLRAGYRISSNVKERLKKHIELFIKTDSSVNEDISDFFYSMKGALLSDYKFQSRLLLPSHYLKTMIALYEIDRDFKNVIVLADKVLEKEVKIDLSIRREIRYWLCLALAREKDERFKNEVQFFKDSDYNFLFGFYYRMIGKPDYALEKYEQAITQRHNFARAQRELVQVLSTLELFDEALGHAKENYENEKSNPFHIQAYFDCLIRTNNPKDSDRQLLRLLDELKKINTRKANEMACLAEADYYLLVRGKPDQAKRIIDGALDEFGISLYSLNRKFNIAEKSANNVDMQDIISKFKQRFSSSKSSDKNILLIMEAKLAAHNGQEKRAISIIDSLNFYPEKSKERLKYNIQQIIKPAANRARPEPFGSG